MARQNRNSQTSLRSTSMGSSHSGVLMVGPNFRVGKKIGCGNFGELRLGQCSGEGGREGASVWVCACACACVLQAEKHSYSVHILCLKAQSLACAMLARPIEGPPRVFGCTHTCTCHLCLCRTAGSPSCLIALPSCHAGSLPCSRTHTSCVLLAPFQWLQHDVH